MEFEENSLDAWLPAISGEIVSFPRYDINQT